MTKYVYDHGSGQMVDAVTGLPMLNQMERSLPPQTPRVEGDYEGYQSPVDGSWIDGRRARRYDLEKNNAIDARDMGGRGFKNKRFIEKHGLQKLAE